MKKHFAMHPQKQLHNLCTSPVPGLGHLQSLKQCKHSKTAVVEAWELPPPVIETVQALKDCSGGGWE